MAASFPIYPATTFEQAVELAIFSSNQLHNIINADALSTVETEDGDISSVRKAITDNLYFKTPAITWAEGGSVTVFNQLYTFSGDTTGTALWYAPTATTANPIVMGESPEDDGNWRLYGWDTYSKSELNSTSGASYIGTSTGSTVEDVLATHATEIANNTTDIAGKVSSEDLIATTGAELVGLEYGKLNEAINDITPEMFGAIGDGVTDDTTAVQSSLTAWLNDPSKEFNGAGSYLVSSSLTIKSPAQGSKGYINTLIKSSDWTDSGTSLFSRTGSLVTLDIDTDNPSNMWGSYFEFGYLKDLSSKSSPSDYYVHGIMNLGWQQCQIEVGLAQGLLSAVFLANTKSTTPTVKYNIRMARGNLINYYAPYNLSNMYEGCTFSTGWSSGGMFCAEMLGNGSTYTHIVGGSADFAGQYLSFVTLTSTPSTVATGSEVTDSSGNLIGWAIGLQYIPGSTSRNLIIAEMNQLANDTGIPTNSAISSGSTITFSGSTYTVSSVACGNTSHTTSRFLPTAICTATTSQTIVRWRIDRDYDSGVILPNDVYYADTQINTTNEATRRKTPLPLGCNFDSGISSGALYLTGARYATQLVLRNLSITTPGGVCTATHSSVWKRVGSAGTTVLVSDGTSTTTTMFTLAALGGGQITGRLPSRATDPATDAVGLWEIVGFGTNTDGSVAVDKWTVLWNGGSGFYVTKTVSGTTMSLATGSDSAGSPILVLTGGTSSAQVATGGSWQYRATALRTFML